MMVPTHEMEKQLSFAISRAWLANGDRIYPKHADNPDATEMANVAATAAASLFCEWIAAARGDI